MRTSVSIVIPFLNEEENIPHLTQELDNFFGQHPNIAAEIIFVNDGSTDQSVGLFKKIKPKNYQGKVISLSKNFGSHAALRAGILHSKGDYIGFIYADLQDPLELIIQLLEQLQNNHDIAWAVRNQTENGLFEKMFSGFYSYMMKNYALSNYPEKGFDIVMFNSKIRENLNANIEANSSIFLQILTLGYSQTTIGYNKQARKKGKSKWTLSKKIKLFIDSFVAFSFAPIRFVTIVGFILFVVGLLWSAYVVSRKLLFNDVASGWPTLISILLLGFGITNISLGIIAEYLWRTMDNTRKRPVFIINEQIDL